MSTTSFTDDKFRNLKPGTLVRLNEDLTSVENALRLGSILMVIEYDESARANTVIRYLNEQGRVSRIHINFFTSNWDAGASGPPSLVLA